MKIMANQKKKADQIIENICRHKSVHPNLIMCTSMH